VHVHAHAVERLPDLKGKGGGLVMELLGKGQQGWGGGVCGVSSSDVCVVVGQGLGGHARGVYVCGVCVWEGGRRRVGCLTAWGAPCLPRQSPGPSLLPFAPR
jgi:hypothetical protein